jgi:hypothetical protein
MYHTFIRTWWKVNKSWPGGLEPHPGRKQHNRTHNTADEARRECEEYNRTHNPGKLSRKMEFESY